MTNADAIEVIRSLNPYSTVYDCHDAIAAINLAIEALQDQSKYEKALHLAAADALGLELGQTNEVRERMISDVARRYKQWTGIKE